ncbi:MAG: EfeM/EfeO family lipoprotein [Nocardioides sp.]|nr:EfeM/EfeO family lipoprotein [Nocardioides sp.]
MVVPLAVLVVIAVVGGVWAKVHDDRGAQANVPHADASVPGTPVKVGTDVCGEGWTGAHAGRVSVAVWNNSIEGMEVYLEDVSTKKVYLDLENLGGTSTRNATATLGPGTYRFVCLPDDADPLTGSKQRITGHTDKPLTPGVVPITDNDLAPALAKYLDWVRGQLPGLRTQVAAISADVARGDTAAAKRDWVTAHARYETLGAAYGAFGDDDEAINAMPRTTVPARSDKDLHGFHKVEALLWSGAPAAQTTKALAALKKAVGNLRNDLSKPSLQTQEISLRAHEILENAIQFELTGRTDAGSHSQLATIDANLTGTAKSLSFITPLLQGRDPVLTQTQQDIATSQTYVRSLRHGSTWPPLDGLPRAKRQRLDALLESTVEDLSRVAVIAEPRRNVGENE